MFFVELIKQEKTFIKVDISAKIDEKYASIIYGGTRFIDPFTFMDENLGTLVNLLKDEVHALTKKLIGNRWELVKQKMPYRFEGF